MIEFVSGHIFEIVVGILLVISIAIQLYRGGGVVAILEEEETEAAGDILYNAITPEQHREEVDRWKEFAESLLYHVSDNIPSERVSEILKAVVVYSRKIDGELPEGVGFKIDVKPDGTVEINQEEEPQNGSDAG